MEWKGNKVYYSPMMSNDLGTNFNDKRNRNPNWTDHEIVRFLEILQEEKVMLDLAANKNKQVFCYVAQKMALEGSEKNWDQCRIKLKNLKSQYRYVKDRIPNIDDVDLEQDEILKQLIAECQGRGISPSHIKHLKQLKRFLVKSSESAMLTLQNALEVRNEILGPSAVTPGMPNLSTASVTGPSRMESRAERHLLSTESDSNQYEDYDDDTDDPEIEHTERKKKDLEDLKPLLNGSVSDGHHYMERFNRDMMDQFMEYQRRAAASKHRWEAERRSQEQLAMEQWRQEAKVHEKQLMAVFCQTVSHCNSAMDTLLKSKQEADEEIKRLKALLEEKLCKKCGNTTSEDEMI